MESRIAEILEAEAEEISILHLLDRGERKLIAPLFELVRFSAGEHCIKEGDRIDFIAIIASGKLEVKHRTELVGRYIPIAILGRGSHIGDLSTMRTHPASGVIAALENTELLVISHDRLNTFMEEHPNIGVKILKGIAGILEIRLERAIDKVVRLS